MKKLTFPLTALAMLASFMLFGCAAKPELADSAIDPVRMVFATDLHYLSQSLTDNGEGFLERISNGDGKVTHYTEPLTDAFVAGLIAEPPDALILGGDLTLNGEQQSHLDLAAKLEPLKKLGVPVLIIPGNHDTDNFMAAGFTGHQRELVDTIDQKEFLKLYGKLGYNDALSRDTDSLSYIYPVRSDLWVLMLDVNESKQFGGFTQKSLAWLTKQLEVAQQQRVTVVSVSHQNILQHNPFFSAGYIVDDNEQLATLLAEHGVPLNLTGHIHLQHSSEAEGGFNEVSTASLAIAPCQYAEISFDGNMLGYSTRPVDVEGWARAQGLTDPALLSFSDTTRRFFWDTAYRSAFSYLSEWGIDEEHVERMAVYYADLNTAYFQGKTSERTAADPDFALWERYEKGEFFYTYISSMLDSTAKSHNSLKIAIGQK